MTYSKVQLFEKELQEISALCKALAHPARLAILKYLAETNVCISGDISKELPLSRTTVNQHLSELKNAGLIQGTIEGVKTNYCLNPEKINQLGKSITDFIHDIKNQSNMKTTDALKNIVKDKYAKIAVENTGCCCSPGTDTSYSVFNESYASKQGYVADADLGLGCGIPTDYAGLATGQKVLDLGSGAGNDCFVARSVVGEEGEVVGLDFTDEMIEKANRNNEKMKFDNVRFVKGDIENMPLDSDYFDVVISNCVLNLVPNKKKAFSEIQRVLNSDGHFCVSDIVLKGELPENLRNAAAMYAGCVSGALQKEDYLEVIENSGFNSVEVVKEREIKVPDEMMLEYVSKEELEKYKSSGAGIFSITVTGSK